MVNLVLLMLVSISRYSSGGLKMILQNRSRNHVYSHPYLAVVYGLKINVKRHNGYICMN